MSVPNGVGGANATTYKYEKGATEIDGRGFLGFQKTHAVDVARNRERIKSIRQDFPYTGQKTQIQTFAAGTLAQNYVQTFGGVQTCESRPVTVPTDVVSASYGLDGQWESKHETYSNFDCYANPQTVTVYQSENSTATKQVKTAVYHGNDGLAW